MTESTVRGYWELAEAIHAGPLRQYAKELRAYLEQVERLVGSDEYRCEVCGVPNVHQDGTNRRSFLVHGGRAFCEEHRAVGEATFQSTGVA